MAISIEESYFEINNGVIVGYRQNMLNMIFDSLNFLKEQFKKIDLENKVFFGCNSEINTNDKVNECIWYFSNKGLQGKIFASKNREQDARTFVLDILLSISELYKSYYAGITFYGTNPIDDLEYDIYTFSNKRPILLSSFHIKKNDDNYLIRGELFSSLFTTMLIINKIESSYYLSPVISFAKIILLCKNKEDENSFACYKKIKLLLNDKNISFIETDENGKYIAGIPFLLEISHREACANKVKFVNLVQNEYELINLNELSIKIQTMIIKIQRIFYKNNLKNYLSAIDNTEGKVIKKYWCENEKCLNQEKKYIKPFNQITSQNKCSFCLNAAKAIVLEIENKNL